MRVLILCTGNSCRSQMAHGFLESFDSSLTVCSAGTNPAPKVNSKAVAVMKEVGIDISHHKPESVEKYLGDAWDYVITVCDDANETCPVFLGKLKHRLHIGFEDPSKVTGSDGFIWSEFRRVRDEIKVEFRRFYEENFQILKLIPMNSEDKKRIVKEKYGEIARQSDQMNETSCCEKISDCCSSVDYTVFSESYEKLDGYNPDADLNLGCGIPTQYAGIKRGDSVLDLGSGAGNDCFVARALVGEEGMVTGIDFTDEMLEKADRNLMKLGFKNVFFIRGDIENMPIPDNNYDVVLSNCVLNLVPDKNKAFSEIYRVLKPYGHFCVSDVVIKGFLPEKLREDAEMYVGCVSGAIEMDEYLGIIKEKGFKNIQIHKQKKISLPDELLANYLTCDDLEVIKSDKIGIFSITVSADK